MLPFNEEIVFPRPVTPKYDSAGFARHFAEFEVPAGRFALWFLGQNGWYLKSDRGTTLVIDPYLSDFCAAGRSGERNAKSRILPVLIDAGDLAADFFLVTHSHCDHADPLTIEAYRRKSDTLFLASFQALPILRDAGVPEQNIVLMHPGQTYAEKDISVTGTFALPTDATDLNHLGYLVRLSGKKYWNSGDTQATPLLGYLAAEKIDAMSVCINGLYANLSHWQAAELAAAVRPGLVLPSHFDTMPHNLQAPHVFRKSLSILAPDLRYALPEYQVPLLV